jgi:transglutaminase-like putative cysteine protease
LTDVPAGEFARIWVPLPQTTTEQVVRLGPLLPDARITHDPDYHNAILYLERRADAAGRISVDITYEVRRLAVSGETSPPEQAPPDSPLFLVSNRLMPAGGKSLSLVSAEAVPADAVAAARLFYDVVNTHMTYRKDQPGWGRGDSDWACGSGFGNCTDFHSLFISMARAYRLPARFDIGFLLPEARHADAPHPIAGYHCWAFVAAQPGRWLPVDISEANQHPEQRDRNFGRLTPDRLTLSTGRDLTLDPPQAGPPLNFFVYPYAEVGGKPHEKMEKHFEFQDVAPSPRQ